MKSLSSIFVICLCAVWNHQHASAIYLTKSNSEVFNPENSNDGPITFCSDYFPCCSNSVCVDNECLCDFGYRRNNTTGCCDVIVCQTSLDCGNNTVCYNYGPNNIYCDCRDGYEVALDTQQCTQIALHGHMSLFLVLICVVLPLLVIIILFARLKMDRLVDAQNGGDGQGELSVRDFINLPRGFRIYRSTNQTGLGTTTATNINEASSVPPLYETTVDMPPSYDSLFKDTPISNTTTLNPILITTTNPVAAIIPAITGDTPEPTNTPIKQVQ